MCVHETGLILELAERCETVGLDSVWAGYPLLAKPQHDPITLMSAIAARTFACVLLVIMMQIFRWPMTYGNG